MTEFHKMSIDKLQEELSRAVHSSGISPAEAILNSKTAMYLSNDIAIFKEALCTKTDEMIKSNEKLAKAQNFHSWAIIVLTSLLVLAGVAQVGMLYWTSQPERTIEMIQALNSWSESQNKSK